jgi:hypothetical protein
MSKFFKGIIAIFRDPMPSIDKLFTKFAKKIKVHKGIVGKPQNVFN